MGLSESFHICLELFLALLICKINFILKILENCKGIKVILKHGSLCLQKMKSAICVANDIRKLLKGNTHDFLLEKYETNGPVYQMNIFGKKMVVVFDLAGLKGLKSVEGIRPRHIDFKHLRTYREARDLPNGVLVSHGLEWARQRRILVKPLSNTKIIKRYCSPIMEVTMETIRYIDNKYCKLKDGTFEVRAISGNYAAEAFGSVLYGRPLGCTPVRPSVEMQLFITMVRNNFQDARKLLVTPVSLYSWSRTWINHCKRWTFLLETTRQNIQRWKEDRKHCVLSTLLEKQKLTDDEIIVNMTDMTTASIDTTSNLIQWCLYETGKRPDVQQKIWEECQNEAKYEEESFEERICSNEYILAVIKETLRLYPVGYLTGRIIERDLELNDVVIPAKTNVNFCMYVIGRDRKLFPDPEVFRPERWLQENPDLDYFYTNVPFGFGPRMCLGRHVAELIVSAFVSSLVAVKCPSSLAKGSFRLHDRNPSLGSFPLSTKRHRTSSDIGIQWGTSLQEPLASEDVKYLEI